MRTTSLGFSSSGQNAPPQTRTSTTTTPKQTPVKDVASTSRRMRFLMTMFAVGLLGAGIGAGIGIGFAIFHKNDSKEWLVATNGQCSNVSVDTADGTFSVLYTPSSYTLFTEAPDKESIVFSDMEIAVSNAVDPEWDYKNAAIVTAAGISAFEITEQKLVNASTLSFGGKFIGTTMLVTTGTCAFFIDDIEAELELAQSAVNVSH